MYFLHPTFKGQLHGHLFYPQWKQHNTSLLDLLSLWQINCKAEHIHHTQLPLGDHSPNLAKERKIDPRACMNKNYAAKKPNRYQKKSLIVLIIKSQFITLQQTHQQITSNGSQSCRAAHMIFVLRSKGEKTIQYFNSKFTNLLTSRHMFS